MQKREEVVFENEDPMEEFVKKRIIQIEARQDNQFDLVNEKGEIEETFLKEFKKRKMELIPLKDHSFQYQEFNKDFYNVH